MLGTIWEASRRFGQASGKSGLAARSKFLVRALLQWSSSLSWFRYLLSQPELMRALPRQAQWLQKLQRPYLCIAFDTACKLELLRQHYTLFFAAFPQALRVRLLCERAIELASFEGKSGASYRIELASTRIMDKEGELMLTLVDVESGETLVTLAFSLGREADGGCRIVLGCLQGSGAAGGRDRFRAVTHDLYGQMPKVLMVKAMGALARQLQIMHILAVSNRGHVHNSRWRGYSPVRSDYDALWTALGGVPAGAYFYRLNACPAERELSDVASRKRAQHLRRKAIESAIASQIAVCWRDHARPSLGFPPVVALPICPRAGVAPVFQ